MCFTYTPLVLCLFPSITCILKIIVYVVECLLENFLCLICNMLRFTKQRHLAKEMYDNCVVCVLTCARMVPCAPSLELESYIGCLDFSICRRTVLRREGWEFPLDLCVCVRVCESMSVFHLATWKLCVFVLFELSMCEKLPVCSLFEQVCTGKDVRAPFWKQMITKERHMGKGRLSTSSVFVSEC